MSELFDVATILALLAAVTVMAVIFAAIAHVVFRALRVRNPSVAHGIWLAAACGMILYPLLHAALPTITIPLIRTEAADDVSLGVLDPAWYPYILSAYGVVAGALLLSVLVGVARSRRLAESGTIPVDREWAAQYAAQFRGSFLRRPATVAVSRRVRVPMTVGFLRPCILLPAESREWSDDKMRSVLAHELAHVRRGDFLWQLVATVHVCLFWFHPVAWMLRRRLVLAAECACDAAAALAVGDSRTYATHLVEIASSLRGGRGRVFQIGLPIAASRDMHTRVDAILDANPAGSKFPSVAGAVASSLCWRFVEPPDDARSNESMVVRSP
jgi:beta-lactamase regulating signal transducer with metallopeptidase domain